MDISLNNVGDVCCLYETGERICIKDVDDNFVTYETENGETFISKNFIFPVIVEEDPERITRFKDNNLYGKALHRCEEKALRTLAFGNIADESERSVVNRILDMVKEQRILLNYRLKSEVHNFAPGAHLAQSFLSQLYKKGPGAEESFFGRRISNIGSPVTGVKIDGFSCSFKDAGIMLSHSPKPQLVKDKKVSLGNMIANASSRKSTLSRVFFGSAKDIDR